MRRLQLRAGGPASILRLLSISAIALVSVVGQARAQSVASIGAVFTTAPFVAAAGEQVLLCAANVTGLTVPTTPSPTAGDPPGGGVTLTVTLSILNGVTGAVVSSTQVTLPPLGSGQYPVDPCLQFAVAPGAFAPMSNLFIGAVMLNPQPLPPRVLPPGACFPSNPCAKLLTSSLQIYTPDPNGNPTHVRVLSFFPPAPCFQAPGTVACTVQTLAN